MRVRSRMTVDLRTPLYKCRDGALGVFADQAGIPRGGVPLVVAVGVHQSAS